jgi:hypothetical protein
MGHFNLFPRRHILVGMLLSPVLVRTTRAAEAIEAKTIDRTVRSETRHFGITFAAEAPSDTSTFGHAFIIWQREDDEKSMSTSDAIGFYPNGDPGNLDIIFGTPGGPDTDIATFANLKLTVLVNEDLYTLALARKSEWSNDGKFRLLWSNCTTHVAAIASAIGLNTSSGSWETPLSYVRDLMGNNN